MIKSGLYYFHWNGNRTAIVYMYVHEFVVIKIAASRLNIALTFYMYSNKFLYNFFYSNRINLLMTIRLIDDCPSVIVFIQALHHQYNYSLIFESRVL